MPTYSLADAEVNTIIEDVMGEYHPPLRDAGVRVQALWAFPTQDKNGDPAGPAITHGGYPCLALFKVLGLKDRTVRGADCEITIDKDEWDGMTDAQRVAMLDHELTHAMLKVDSEGAVVRDAIDRPKLRCRRHDRQLGWFDEVARRHGIHSQEVMQARKFIGEAAQTYLPGFEIEELEEAATA